ncbi:hypothetical protein [Paenibacillus solani]|uniref:hypothetical protein n=1 Tax=Paenibacillus solani TaxID=1705565 RepID=UPI003D26DAE1
MKMRAESIIYPLPTDQLLSKEEGFWRVALPSDYREFIKINNGGIRKDVLLAVMVIIT